MRAKSTMSKKAYICYNVAWGLYAAYLFQRTIFGCVPGWTLFESRAFFWTLYIFTISCSIVVTIQRNRNNWNIVLNLLFPLELYYLFSQKNKVTGFSMVVILGSAAISVLRFCFILFQPIKNRSFNKEILCRRLWCGGTCVKNILALGMTLLLVPNAVSLYFGGSLVAKSTAAIVPKAEEQCTIADNMKTLDNLKYERWELLSNTEKTNVLQTVANIEASYLGLPHELNLVVSQLGESIIASYQDKNHIIAVNIDFLESATSEMLVEAVCHEARHAFQKRLCDVYANLDDASKNLLLFAPVKCYITEFENYEDGDDDSAGYYRQMCEQDAREYAQESIQLYINSILYNNSY